jgi:SAM-dependent methyltransferase
LLLELGAGAGRNSPRYSQFERVVLLDYSLTQLQQAQERLGRDTRYTFVAADIYRLPFVAGLFDAVTMIRTLHHMADPQLALAQVRQVMQPAAAFILEYANKTNLKAILRYAARRQSWNPFTREPVEFAPLNFDFHSKSVRGWLAENQFKVRRQLTVSHFRINWLKEHLPINLLVRLDAAFQPTGNLWQLTPSVFVLAQATGDSPLARPGEFFRCPACGSASLNEKDQSLTCSNCGKSWVILDGIYDLRG